jgi:hypothetical protein
MKRNLLVFAVSLVLVIGFSTSASALNHPWSWIHATESEDHTWGGEQGWGTGGGSESYGPVTGVLTLDILIIRLIGVVSFDDKDHGVIKTQIDTGQGGPPRSWHQEQPISFRRGE